jgi:hypothetical protein
MTGGNVWAKQSGDGGGVGGGGMGRGDAYVFQICGIVGRHWLSTIKNDELILYVINEGHYCN